MKNGGKNKSVAFNILFSVVYSYAVTLSMCFVCVLSENRMSEV